MEKKSMQELVYNINYDIVLCEVSKKSTNTTN